MSHEAILQFPFRMVTLTPLKMPISQMICESISTASCMGSFISDLDEQFKIKVIRHLGFLFMDVKYSAIQDISSKLNEIMDEILPEILYIVTSDHLGLSFLMITLEFFKICIDATFVKHLYSFRSFLISELLNINIIFYVCYMKKSIHVMLIRD